VEEGEKSVAHADPVPQTGLPSSAFEDYRDEDIRDLISEFPLAWVCSRRGGAEFASLLPIIGEYDQAGRLTHLVGHLARANPLHDALRAEGRALFLFTGPQAYVSPGDVGQRNWAPTWIYASARVEAEVAFEPHCTEEAVDILVRAMEAGRDKPWQADELGGRYGEMIGRIIGFRARVTKLRGRFKLGQDESRKVLKEMIVRSRHDAMRRWIVRFNGAGRRGQT
jgi:transcriptional regulator